MATAINVTSDGTGVAFGGSGAENNKVKAYVNFYVESTGGNVALYLHKTPVNMASWRLINESGILKFQSDYLNSQGKKGDWYSLLSIGCDGVFRINGKLPCDLGNNITNGKANETASFWHNQGFGVVGFSKVDQLNNQPSQYGALLNLKNDSKTDLSQLWITQGSGEMYTRAIYNTLTTWRRQIDNVNILEWFKCGTSAASGKPTVNNGGIYIQY